MPVIRIEVLAGKTKEQKKRMIEGITQVVTAAIGIEPEKVWIVINDVPPENWGSGGKQKG
jgi:4-oxalocrotonate tautomerase